MDTALLEQRLAALEKQLIPAPQDGVALKVHALLEQSKQILDQSFQEFYQQYQVLDQVAQLAEGDAKNSLNPSMKASMIASASDDLQRAVNCLQQIVDLAPAVEIEPKREATLLGGVKRLELETANMAERVTGMHLQILSLIETNFKLTEQTSQLLLDYDNYVSSLEEQVDLALEARNIDVSLHNFDSPQAI
eukprot:TRINITY_DN8353_c0_g1_i1.p1 TRINITY_DN8353_c0_g1~~TRINITY_DN8353_c0_g1_i1.p1  ORF type:complete len:206 (-),score=53.48 TRINITY_DN8353_c0_g1_i1:16-591(-)